MENPKAGRKGNLNVATEVSEKTTFTKQFENGRQITNSDFFFENLIQTLFLDGKLQVFQIAPSLHVVELKKAKGDTLEFQKVLVSSNSLCGSLKAVKLGR